MKHAAAALVIVALAVPALAQTPSQPAGWVVLPVSDYRALRDLAYPPEKPPEPPPVAAAISRVEYDLAVQGESAAGQARLTVDVFRDGWVSVPIPAGLRVRDAKIDGKPVPLVDNIDGRSPSRSVLLSHSGRALITLDLAVPIAARAGVESLALPASPSPVERVSLSLKAPDLALTVTGGFIAERTASPDAVRFLVCGRQGAPLGLSWSRHRDTPATAQALRLRGAVTEIVGLSEDSAQVSAQIDVDVVQGTADRVTVKLPPAFSVSQVAGPLVADWEVRGTDLVVSFLEPAEHQASVAVTGETRTPRDGKIEVPLLRLGNAEREAGGIAVEVLGAGEIKESTRRALDAADPSDLGAAIAARISPALVAFRARPQAWDAVRSLEVTVARYTPQAVLLANIEEARFLALLTEDGKALVEAAYAIRNSQRSFAAVTLPAGATLWSASVDGQPVRPGRSADGALLLPILNDRGRSNVASTVRLLFVDRAAAWSSEGTVPLRLPAVDLPVSRTGLQVYHSPRYRLTLEPGPFHLAPYEPPGNPLRSHEAGMGSANRPLPPPAAVRAGQAQAPDLMQADAKDKRAADQELIDLAGQYRRATRAGSIAGLLPLDLHPPELGPSIYAATELTPEKQAPEVRFTFKREVK